MKKSIQLTICSVLALWVACLTVPAQNRTELEAFQAATLVQTAEALAAVRDHLRRDVVDQLVRKGF